MNNLTEIKSKLDNYYQKYKNNSYLNSGEEKLVTELIVDIIFLKDGSLRDVAVELARFPANITDKIFLILPKNKSVSLETINDILKELSATDNNVKLSQYYVSKYVFAITSIIKYYKDDALAVPLLSRLVIFIARFAVKSDTNKKKFCNLIKNTEGYIFKLNYSNYDKSRLNNIWKAATDNNYPDLLAPYKTCIVEWGKKYNFIDDKMIEKESEIISNKTKKEDDEVSKNSILETDKPKEQSVSKNSRNYTLTLNDNVNPISNDEAAKANDQKKAQCH